MACRLAEKLRILISGHAWSGGVALRCSFGVAQMERDEDIGNVFRRADAALYRAKQHGRNRVVCSPGTGPVGRDQAA